MKTRSDRVRVRTSGILAACGVALAALAGGAWVGAQAPAPAGPSTGAERFYRFTPGEQLAYDLSYESAGKLDMRPLLGQETSSASSSPPSAVSGLKTSLSGTLVLTVLDSTAEGMTAACRVDGPSSSLASNGQTMEEQAAVLGQELGRPFFVMFGPDGACRLFYFPTGESSLARNFAQALVATLQVVVPEAASLRGKWWTVKEEDLNGRYTARYRVLAGTRPPSEESAGEQVRIAKTRESYDSLGPAEHRGTRTLARRVVPSGSLAGVLDPRRGFVVSLEGSLSETIFIQGKLAGEAHTAIRLHLLRSETTPEENLSRLVASFVDLAEKGRPSRLSEGSSPEEKEAMIQRSELGEATVESLLESLAQAEKRPDGQARASSLYLKFKALAYLHPEDCAALGDVLAKAPVESSAFQILSGALRAAGSPAAQSAIAKAVRARPDSALVARALLPCLALVDAPTPEAEAVLRAAAFSSADPEISATGRLALGAAARRIAKQSQPRAQAIVADLVASLRPGQPAAEEKILILALGNSGSLEAMPAILARASSESSALRSAAMEGLRWINLPQAETALLRGLGSDPDATVRLFAAKALGFRTPDSAIVEAETAAFSSEKDGAVRLQLLQDLGKARETSRVADAAVRRAASADPSPDVRKEAKRLLETRPTQ